jgi:hypothetical protein
LQNKVSKKLKGLFGIAPLYVFYSNGFSSRTLFEEKEVLHKLQFFMELLHGGVCGAVPNILYVIMIHS